MAIKSWILGLALATMGAAALAQSPATPAPRPYEPDVFEALHRAPDDPATTVMVGGTLIAQWRGPLDAAAPPPLFLGVKGDLTQNLLWRLSLTRLNPRVQTVALAIGADNACQSPDEAVAQGVEADASKLKAMAPKARLLVISLLPQGRSMKACQSGVQHINQLLSDWASGHDAVFVNAYATFLEICEMENPCDLYQSDQMSLSEHGYGTLRAIILRAMDSALGAPQA